MDRPIVYDLNTLNEFCISMFIKAGMISEEAEIMSDTLMFAEMRNVKSHGIIRLPTYIERMEKGVVNNKPEMKLTNNQYAAVSMLNADNGMGQVAGYKAMKEAMNIAKVYGIGMVAVKNSNHFGVASYYSMMASKDDMIGLVMTNASPAIAPFGTKAPLLGTNPLSVAVPAKYKKPIVLDMSMSTVARGKIRMAALQNKEIPLDWGLDEEGNPTADPYEALKGSLVPIGGVKGSGLSLIVDLLTGVLTDTSLTGEVKNITDMSGPSKTSHVFIAVNISSFIDTDVYKKNVDSVVNNIKSLPPKGNNEIFMAGEIEQRLMDERRSLGIPVEIEVIEELNKLAEKYDGTKL
ncbi:Ldh family oxidoreductase [Sedimentibacter sp.]|uniref:Ldh family oxidoreductase n=1 Tax=Sedimentibacter sp. TaxID=1960295 RepID=UPI000ED62E39|nr:Ldh family oxidoreductase [Sedimentibacter sp.]HCX62924.1 lactate dehydrogenase [Clostridiales bacterium]